MSHMKSCDRHKRSKEVCQVREKTVEEKVIVYGFQDERTGKVSINEKVNVKLTSFSPAHSKHSEALRDGVNAAHLQ